MKYLSQVNDNKDLVNKKYVDDLVSSISGTDTTPIGAVVEWYSSTIPEDWLLCDGRAVSRTTYSELFSVIGTTFGSGDGSTTFNLPNRKGRVAIGLNSSDTSFSTLGKTGGAKVVTLDISQMPKHSHEFTGISHSHGLNSHTHTYAKVDSTSGGTKLTAAMLPAHTHTYDKSNSTSGGTKLTAAMLPAHTHTYSKASTTSGGTKLTAAMLPAHTHTYDKANSTTGGTAITVAQMPSHNHALNGLIMNTNSKTNTYLTMQADGNMVIYTTGGQAPWGAGTEGKSGSKTHWEWVLGRSTDHTDVTSKGSGNTHNHSISTTSTNSGSAYTATSSQTAHTHSISLSDATSGSAYTATDKQTSHTHSVSTTSTNTGSAYTATDKQTSHTHSISTTSTNSGAASGDTSGATATGTISETGGTDSINILNPYIVANFIIKSKKSETSSSNQALLDRIANLEQLVQSLVS